jgi:hypothetical protein
LIFNTSEHKPSPKNSVEDCISLSINPVIMNLFNISSIISFSLLSLTLINIASAASFHGHRRPHARENTPKVPHQHFQINATSPNLNSVTAEPAKAQQRQRHSPRTPQRPRDLLRVEKGHCSKNGEMKETAAWMRQSMAILALGLILGAEMVN